MRFLNSTVCLLAFAGVASAQVLWEDNLDTDTSLNYTIFEFLPGRDGAVFGFDYGELGIPSAPNSDGGSTTGVKLFSNDPFEDTSAAPGGVQLVPFDLDLFETPKYALTFDVWVNVNGPLPLGGGGSTEAIMAGVGFSGLQPIEAGNTDGTYFTMTGEGGALTDLRSFTAAGFNAPGVNIAPVGAEDDYYASIFPGGVDVGSLPVQGGQDSQTGTTTQGQMAFQWHEIRVEVDESVVDFFIDDLIIARDEDAAVDGSVVIGYFDYFGGSVSDVPEWAFSVVDNIKVFVPFRGELGDFDQDEDFDAADMELLCGAIRDSSSDERFDLTGDGQLDGADIDSFLQLVNSLPGDADLDGAVQFPDFLALSANFGQAASWSGGDFDCSGQVQFPDFLALSSNFGMSADMAGQAAAVPEPGSQLSLLVGLLVMITAGQRVGRS